MPSDTDYDSGTDSVLFTAGEFDVPETVTVDILNEGTGLAALFPILVEGGLTNDAGFEEFLANLDITTGSMTLGDRSLDDDDTAIGQIVDQDDLESPDSATVILSVTDGLAAEPGDNGEFTDTQSEISRFDTVIAYTIESGDPNDATPGVDYVALSGTVTIPAGQTTATIDVTVLDDATVLLEDDEFVRITLDTLTSADPNISIDPDSTTEEVLITDDDQGSVSITANIPNAAEPSTNGQFTVTQTELSDTDTEVQFVVESGVGNATPGADYVALTGTVTIPAGSLSAVIDVTVLDDSLIESPENVTVTLTGFATGLTNADLMIDGDGVNDQVANPDNDTATVVIDGTDSNINVLITAVTDGSEFNPDDPDNDDEEPNNGVFRVELQDDFGNPVPAPTGGVLVTYAVGGTADPAFGSDGDYTALTGVLNFGGGQSVAFITVDVTEDTEVEPTETVTVTLETATNNLSTAPIPVNTTGVYVVDGTTETVNITDDDFPILQPSGVFVRGSGPGSSGFSALFSDVVDDSTVNATSRGFDVTSLTGTVPFINANEIVIEFPGPVSVSDYTFTLTGVAGSSGLAGPATVVDIDTVAAGPGNTIVLTLTGALEASRMTLTVASDTTQTFDFTVLPGDFNNDSQVSVTDLFDSLARQGTILNTDGSFSGATPSTSYDLRADFNGDGSINATDLFAVLGLQNSLPPSISAFTSSVVPGVNKGTVSSALDDSGKEDTNTKLEFARTSGLSGAIESSKTDFASDEREFSNDFSKTKTNRTGHDVKILDSAFENDFNLEF